MRGKLKTLRVCKSIQVVVILNDKNTHAYCEMDIGVIFLIQTHNSMEHLAMMEKVLGPIPSHLLEQTK